MEGGRLEVAEESVRGADASSKGEGQAKGILKL